MTHPQHWSIVVAMSRNGVIGSQGSLPWHLPADLRHFKKITMGKPVVMGRRTWESIGRPLPGRTNIVLTRSTGGSFAGATVIHSLAELPEKTGHASEIMIIGGAEVYREALPKVDRLYITRVDAEVSGDVGFPEVLWQEWVMTDSEAREPDEQNACRLIFEVWTRKK